MSHEIEIEGCLTVPDKVNLDDVTNAFLEFVESHGWCYGGGLNEFKDDHYECIDIGEED